MAKEKRVQITGAELVNDLIEIGDGVKMDTRLRVSGMLFLEERFDCPLGQIKFSEGGRVVSLIPLFVALVIQANEGMTSEEAEKHVRAMDSTTMIAVANKIPKMLAVPESSLEDEDDTENPPPAAVTEETPAAS